MSTPYGYQYTPSTLDKRDPPTLWQLQQRAGVQYVRFTWVDLSNTIRYRIIPIHHFNRIMDAAHPSISLASCALGLVMNSSAPGFGAVGVQHYIPDMESLRYAPYAPQTASVFGFFNEADGKPSGLCPRGLLKRVLEDAAKETSTQFLVGFETEFILLRKKEDGTLVPGNSYPWSSSRATLTGSPETQALAEIVETLNEAYIRVEMYHAEAAPGQYELITGALTPLEAADALIFTRETIVNVANKYGLHATFAPQVFDGVCGSGCHIHISLHDTTVTPPPQLGSKAEASTQTGEGAPTSAPTSEPTPGPSGLTAKEASFVSGVLGHLPALTALTLPTAASYARVVDHVWSGGTYVCWGGNNREAPIRVCGTPGSLHFELKTHDGTANPYIALAAVLGAGARAIGAEAELTIGEATKPAALMTADERSALGIRDRLPKNLKEARQRLAQDGTVLSILGEIGKVWAGVNEFLETSLEKEKDNHDGNIGRVMIEYY